MAQSTESVWHLEEAASRPISSTHAASLLLLLPLLFIYSYLSCKSRLGTQAAAVSVRNVPIPTRGEGGGGKDGE
jgi:hypothetical protein